MQTTFVIFIFTVTICILPEPRKCAVYHVLPTDPISSCPGSSSCPPNQLCHTMNYLVEHSSKLFTPRYVNVTLIFLCGAHNYTKDLTIQGLHSFTMKGAIDSKDNTIVNMLSITPKGRSKCTTIHYFNVSFVTITTLTIRCPSMTLENGLISVKNSDFYGYPDTEKILSFINILGSGSQASLEKCIFKENCFLVSNMSAGVIVSNSMFQSYRHRIGSIIKAFSSHITLTGNVSFTDSHTGAINVNTSNGTAVLLKTTHIGIQSCLNITTSANIRFVNLSCSGLGGAVYILNGVINVGAKANVVFLQNIAHWSGGAVWLHDAIMNISVNSTVVFAHHSAPRYNGGTIWLYNGLLNIDTNASVIIRDSSAYDQGGAIHLIYGALNIKNNASVIISHSYATRGGALYLYRSTIHVDRFANILFYNNTATQGGAIYFYYGFLYINTHRVVQFTKNSAQLEGGAIYIKAANHSASTVTVDNSTKLLFSDNFAFQGGSLYIIPSSFAIEARFQSSIEFVTNRAVDVGGAIYSELQTAAPCIFSVSDYSTEISFIENSANRSVGHHIYGSSIRSSKCDKRHILLDNERGKPYCLHQSESYEHINFSFKPALNQTLSSISSFPWRVCLCDSNGRPQCANFSLTFPSVTIYRGETFTISVCVVGYNFGTTTGSVYSSLNYPTSYLKRSQNHQLVSSNEMCTSLKYTVYTKESEELLQLQTSVLPLSAYSARRDSNFAQYKSNIYRDISDYTSHVQVGCISEDLLTTPVFINITLLPDCPPGLTLKDGSTNCTCYAILTDNDFNCWIQNKSGFLQWTTSVWVNATFSENQSNGIIYNRFCPANYCKSGNKIVNIGDDPSKQCASNRTGILCGSCMDNFSLAIGSSRCIECPRNNHNVSLVIAFVTAGFFLVFFILATNLTVTQGLINGLIFYSNIMWAFKAILFPSELQENFRLLFLQVFIAWLNLDFGIETCFFIGLNAYWKTWLQFLFPFYIWAIAGVIIIACRYSSHLTNLIGSRVVPLLATLFLLSYIKLLHTIIDSMSVAVVAQYPQNTSYAVWYLDGNLRHCQHPHIYLFIAAIATFIFLWLPYTLLLLFIQPLRRVSHLRPLKWINKFAPVYDAYLSPLKHKHQYWFGAMLLVRGILLIILTVTSTTYPEFNVLLLSVTIAFLLCFMSIISIYRKRNVRVSESITLINLIVISTGVLYKWEDIKSKTLLLEVSIWFAFVQFCVIIVWSLIKPCFNTNWWHKRETIYEEITHERIEDPELDPLIDLPRDSTTTVIY